MSDKEMKDIEITQEELEQAELTGVSGGAVDPLARSQCPNCGHMGYNSIQVKTAGASYMRYTCPECGHKFAKSINSNKIIDTGVIGARALANATGMVDIDESGL